MRATSYWILVGFVTLMPVMLAGAPLPNLVVAPHARDLVVLNGDKLAPFDAAHFLQAPYIILYFGAGWCPDCRRFSPALVEAYNRQGSDSKKFEVLLLSREKIAAGMLQFMKMEKMTWPALSFEKLPEARDLEHFYSGHGIPCLTVIDSQGAVVLQSKDDQDAHEVLHQLQILIKAKPGQ